MHRFGQIIAQPSLNPGFGSPCFQEDHTRPPHVMAIAIFLSQMPNAKWHSLDKLDMVAKAVHYLSQLVLFYFRLCLISHKYVHSYLNKFHIGQTTYLRNGFPCILFIYLYFIIYSKKMEVIVRLWNLKLTSLPLKYKIFKRTIVVTTHHSINQIFPGVHSHLSFKLFFHTLLLMVAIQNILGQTLIN